MVMAGVEDSSVMCVTRTIMLRKGHGVLKMDGQ